MTAGGRSGGCRPGGHPGGGHRREPEEKEVLYPPEERIRIHGEDAHPSFWITTWVRWSGEPNTLSSGQERSKWKNWDTKDDREQMWTRIIEALDKPQRRKLLRSWISRRSAWLEPLKSAGLARQIRFRNRSPVVIWLSAASPLETGFCLHRTYGVPYLPGSALKGLAASAAWREIDPKAKERPSEIDHWFGQGGDEGHEGTVAFLDGIPIDVSFEPEVMTPHAADYYAGRGKPHGFEGPNPVSFLRIAPDCEFEVALVATGTAEDPKEALDRAQRWLVKGMTEMGLGAKTTSGYGRFEVVGADSPEPARPEPASDGPKAEGTTGEGVPGGSSQGAVPSSAEFVVEVVRFEEKRNPPIGVGRREDGSEVEFLAHPLANEPFGVFRPQWKTIVKKRIRVRREGEAHVPVDWAEQEAP